MKKYSDIPILISIIVTTHNRPKSLTRALNSITEQSIKNTQIVLCSDESSKETKNIATNYLREQDIFLVLPQVKGPSGTRNAGLKFARGQYICFLDDDDYFEENFFKDVFATNCISEDKLYYFNWKVVLDGNSDMSTSKVVEAISLPHLSKLDLLYQNFIANNSFILSRLLAKEIAFDEYLKSHEDWDYLIGLSKIVEFQHLDIWGPVVVKHPIQESRNPVDGSNKKIIDYLYIYYKWPGLDERVINARYKLIGNKGIAINKESL
jgi:glycosyltransferase involved in cell wall biosynthesis